MSLSSVTVVEAIERLAQFDAVIDARSESEYALDHLPGAVNWPTLHDDQHKSIGTLYSQVNPFEARKRGAALAARNIAQHIEREVIAHPKTWQPLVYCWRGGQRSGALALILSEIGFRVKRLEGGYKAFRAAVVEEIPRRVAALHWQVIAGKTGSGKTRLLQALLAQGAQVIDLEALAQHRSSVLGAVPGVAQPSQKGFDTRLWLALRQLDPQRPVFIESESRKVGNLMLPAALMQAMHQSPCLNLLLPDEERVALLLEEYDFFARDIELFCERLQVLAAFKGKAVVDGWQTQLRSGDIAPVVQALLSEHYDPAYLQSMKRNFVQFDQARIIAPVDHSMAAMAELAKKIIRDEVKLGSDPG